MWWMLPACQALFGTDRHDLVGSRVAALEVAPGAAGEAVVPRAALIVEGHPWSDSAVDLLWYWVEGPDSVLALDPTSRFDGSGPAPNLIVPRECRTLALIARYPDGEEDRAFHTLGAVGATAPALTGISTRALPLKVSGVEGAELTLEARADLSTGTAETVAVGGFVRLMAEVSGDPLVRWMGTAGTFFELDRREVDWAAGDLLLDGEDLAEGRSALEPGPVTFLALALGDPGLTAFRAADRYVGDAPPGLWVAGRFLPTEVAVDFVPGQAVRGRLALDDASPTGLRLTGGTAEPVPAFDWGTRDLLCEVQLDGPFDPSWLLSGVCTRPGVDGVEVVVIPEEGR